jgi:hypothetical protein
MYLSHCLLTSVKVETAMPTEAYVPISLSPDFGKVRDCYADWSICTYLAASWLRQRSRLLCRLKHMYLSHCLLTSVKVETAMPTEAYVPISLSPDFGKVRDCYDDWSIFTYLTASWLRQMTGLLTAEAKQSLQLVNSGKSPNFCWRHNQDIRVNIIHTDGN